MFIRSIALCGRRVCLSIALLLLFAGCARRDPGPEVWIIGLDAADWDLLDPLMERGLLPNLAALREGGASGVLLSDEPMLSPILWTSIATGRTPDVHGVTWFMTDGPDGAKVPVGTEDRRVRALWNIADEHGLSSGVVGWWASWPAEPVRGWIATDYVGWHSFGVSGREAADAGKVWPADLMDDVDATLPAPGDVSLELLRRLVHLPDGQLAHAAGEGSFGSPLTHLRQSMATTQGYTDLVLRRLGKDRPDLLAVYFEGTDAVQHLFGEYAAPQLPWIDAADHAAYRDVVDEYWRWQDALLGRLLAARGPETTVVIVSDHGFRIGDERRMEDVFSIDTADSDHMPDGMILVNGPGVSPGATIRGADIYDVTPTVLHLLGLPAAEDMPGEVLADIFLPEAGAPAARVATYETTPIDRTWMPQRRAEDGARMERMLRSLGYIAGADDGSAPAASPVAGGSVEQAVNLATILMKQERFDEAVEQLRGILVEHPDHFETRLNLAQALARGGRTAEAEPVYAALLAAAPDRLIVHEDYARCLGAAGKPEEALRIYELGLVQDPRWVNGLSGKGHALFLTGRPAEALAVLTRAVEIDPRDHDAYYYLGLVQTDRGDFTAAARALSRAHELEPSAAGTGRRLAGVLERLGRLDEAVRVLERVRDNGGAEPALFADLGALLLRTERPAEAVRALETALTDHPDDADLLGNLGVAHAMQGNLPRGIALFERLVELLPGAVEPHAQLAAFYDRAGRQDAALSQLTAAARLAPQDGGLQLRIGMLEHKARHPDAARRAYREAIRLAPDLALAYYNLGMLEGASGHRDEAGRLLARARELDPGLPAGPGDGGHDDTSRP
jgi:tetratricopeptide (TPR) repeat protein